MCLALPEKKPSGNQGQHWYTLTVHSKAVVSQEQGEVTVVLSDLCTSHRSPLLRQVQHVQDCRDKTFRRWWLCAKQASLPPPTRWKKDPSHKPDEENTVFHPGTAELLTIVQDQCAMTPSTAFYRLAPGQSQNIPGSASASTQASTPISPCVVKSQIQPRPSSEKAGCRWEVSPMQLSAAGSWDTPGYPDTGPLAPTKARVSLYSVYTH